MAPEAGDQFAVALWRAHLERALRAAQALKAGKPVPQVAARDPYALRGLVAHSGGRGVLCRRRRSHQAHRRGVRLARRGDAANYRIDAWVTPPAYTGRPPLILPGLRPGEQSQARASGPVTVPAGSTLVVRSTGQSGLDVAVKGGIAEAKPEAKPQAPKGTEERHFTITAAGTATVKGGGDDVVWTLQRHSRIAPPTIALAKEPEAQLRGSLLLNYKLEDDYGVVDAQATFERKPAATDKPRRPRPSRRARCSTRPISPWCCRRREPAPAPAQTTKDLSEHPWAGVDVTMTLVARDEANNEGRSSAARDAVAGTAVRQAAAARADRAAPQSCARCQRQGQRAERARRAHHRAGAVHPGNQRLSRVALDLLAAFARRERRRPARRGGAAVVDGGVPRGRQRLGDREAACARRRTPCARRWSAARPTKRSRS